MCKIHSENSSHPVCMLSSPLYSLFGMIHKHKSDHVTHPGFKLTFCKLIVHCRHLSFSLRALWYSIEWMRYTLLSARIVVCVSCTGCSAGLVVSPWYMVAVSVVSHSAGPKGGCFCTTPLRCFSGSPQKVGGRLARPSWVLLLSFLVDIRL